MNRITLKRAHICALTFCLNKHVEGLKLCELTAVGSQHVDHSSWCAHDDLSSSFQLGNLQSNRQYYRFTATLLLITIFIYINTFCVSSFVHITQRVEYYCARLPVR